MILYVILCYFYDILCYFILFAAYFTCFATTLPVSRLLYLFRGLLYLFRGYFTCFAAYFTCFTAYFTCVASICLVPMSYIVFLYFVRLEHRLFKKTFQNVEPGFCKKNFLIKKLSNPGLGLDSI